MSHPTKPPIKEAPIAVKKPKILECHGHQRVDNYYWMRDDDRQSEEVLQHLKRENDYADYILAPQAALKDEIFEELKERIVKDDTSVPVKDGAYWYFTQVSGEDEFEQYYRCNSFEKEGSHLLLNVNQIAENFEYFELGDIAISPNDNVMAYSQDTDGRRIYTIKFKCLETGKYLSDELENTEGQLVWANNNTTVFYVKKDLETLLGFQVYRHELGSLQQDDVLVYEEQDDSFYLCIGKSRDDSTIFVDAMATDTSDVWTLSADSPLDDFKPLCARETGHEFGVNKLGHDFFILTNWQAKNFRLMSANVHTVSDKTLWQELIPHRADVLLEDVEYFDNHIVVTEKEQGQTRIVVHNRQGKSYPLVFNDPCYFAQVSETPETASKSVRITYSSLTTPPSSIDIDLASGEKKVLKQQKVPGNFDADLYKSERVFVPARDGVLVPVSLVYRIDMFKKDGSNPLLQDGYGAYGITMEPRFSSALLSLLDRGFVSAIAHIRGEEMLGRHWYEQGRMEHKHNTFNDFIDVSNFLIEHGYTAKNKLFASGGSAGGLLMAAIANQAPHLYCGIGCHVPFVDVLTTMLDESIPLTTNEYDEWGNPNKEADYKNILSYSPIDNISAQTYPHLLVTTGLHDSQVQYWEPMKWVAKLREYQTGDNMLVFKTDMDSGHGGASGRYKSLHERALELAFFVYLSQL